MKKIMILMAAMLMGLANEVGHAGVKAGWISTDVRLDMAVAVDDKSMGKEQTLTAWRGERVAAQWVATTSEAIEKLEVKLNGMAGIPEKNIRLAYSRYVMTDELNKDGLGGCGSRPNKAEFDSSMVADALDYRPQFVEAEANSSRGGWVIIEVPRDCKAEAYSAELRVVADGKTINTLKLKLKVLNRTLPEAKDYSFHLDLWQNPYAEARYYGVSPFTKEHFEAMRPDMELYARAGGKVVTTSIIQKPWNGQTYDPFASMVTWMKKADGTWMYDYTVFDMWVEFMMSMGVDKQINCYSMVPWRLSFQYFDQASNTMKYLESKPGKADYEEFWVGMLRDFSRHLRDKGWFDITHIAFDERPMDMMLKTLEVIRKADPQFKVAFAGLHHPELMPEINDYCSGLFDPMSDAEIAERQAKGFCSTFYTCCTEPRPNTFTFSPLAEAEWIGWYAAAANYDGYLRWALNSWTEKPFDDSRFITWAAGDCYIIYPYGISSMRFERLIQGVQAYEKVKILREEYKDNPKMTAKLNAILSAFKPGTLTEKPAAGVVAKAKQELNKL